MKRSRFHSRGFSFLELLVVVVVIGILTLVVISSYSTFRRTTRIKGGAQRINSCLVAARAHAVSTNSWYRVVLQLDNNSFWVDEIEPDSNTTPNPVLPEPARRPKVSTPELLPVGLRITDVAVAAQTPDGAGPTPFQLPADRFVVIRFRPDGSSDFASIHLLGENTDPLVDQNYYTVLLYSASAKSRIIPRARM